MSVMNPVDILRRIDAFDPYTRRNYFCLLMQNMLIEYLRKQGKTFKSDYISAGYEFDGFAPDGVDGYEGPTVFEIFYRRMPTAHFRRKCEVLHNCVKVGVAKRGILICVLDENFIMPWLDEYKDVVVWKRDKVLGLIEQNLPLANEVVGNLFKLEIEKRGRETDNSDWKEERKVKLWL